MIRLEQIVDLDNLSRRIMEGYVVERTGPDGLRLWNYTAKCQYERAWDNETRRCRGLVADAEGFVIARPFEKFFIVGELPQLPIEPFEVTEKLDGSLIVVAQGGDGLCVTSRGSFDSPHAAAGRLLWTRRYVGVAPPVGQTWCLELIAPWNRIVVDYGGREDLVLLAALDNATGRDVPCEAWPGPRVRTFDMTEVAEVLARLSLLGPDEEGYVLRFLASGLRVKAKGDEYVRLHSLVTGVTARKLWELLSTGASLAAVIDRVPDEFAVWVQRTVTRLTDSYAAIEREARARHEAVAALPTRKDQALAIAGFAHRAIVFRMLDGQPYAAAIWKLVYPGPERPFRAEDA